MTSIKSFHFEQIPLEFPARFSRAGHTHTIHPELPDGGVMIDRTHELLIEPQIRATDFRLSSIFKAILAEFFRMDDQNRRLTSRVVFATFLSQCLLISALPWLLMKTLSILSIFNILIFIFFIATIYNTVWLHRYCSHAAFEFSCPVFAKLLLWSNPLALCFREETYAIPHRVHHQKTDKPNDPYGPHLGWLATFFATELTQRINSEINECEYSELANSIGHIGLQHSPFVTFQRNRSIEKSSIYYLRVAVSQGIWGAIMTTLGGYDLAAQWYVAIAIVTILIRDFNWRGHGGKIHRPKLQGWEFDNSSHALNQRFYGYLASEWHDNHHNYPFSANNGFLPGQIDIAFHFIKFLYRIGIVKSYVDAKPLFEKECLGMPGGPPLVISR